MASPSPSPIRPLPAGEILYAVQETALICESAGSNNARFHRITFTGSEKNPQATVRDSTDLGPYDDIRHARAVTDGSLKQGVAILTKTGLSFIAIAKPGQVARPAAVNANVNDAVLVIGFAPIHIPGAAQLTAKRSLALLATAGVGFAVVEVDLDTGGRVTPKQLPPQVRGTAVAAELVRHGSSTVLLVTTIAENSLLVHAVDWRHLAAQVQPEHVKTLALGSVLTGLAPDLAPYPKWKAEETSVFTQVFKDNLANHDQVASLVVRMCADSSDQQLAVAWIDPAGSLSIALVGWGTGGEASVLATAGRLATTFSPVCRLAAADLFHNGAEQLVLGSTFDNKVGIPGYVSLQLFTLDTSSAPATPALHCQSKLVAADNVDEFPLAVLDFQISAGVFGAMKDITDGNGCFGVQILGHRLQDKSFVCGFVPVDPVQRAFPPMDHDQPAPANMAPNVLDSFAQEGGSWGEGVWKVHKYRFHAFPCDLSGESVVLGAPTLSQSKDTVCSQILAIIQAHPFHREVKLNNPTVTFNTSSGETQGVSTSSDTSWAFSDDISVSLGLGTWSLSANIHNSQLSSLTKTDDNSVSTSVTVHNLIIDADIMVVSEISFNVWHYPVLRAASEYPAELLVIVPLSATLSTQYYAANDLPYRPRSEVGMLLSYVDVKKDGYNPDKVLFPNTVGYDVEAGQDSTEITFDISQSISHGDSLHLGIQQSVSTHFNVTGQTDLFEELPLSFGLNLGRSYSYSQSHIKTANLTLQKGMSLSFASGTVEKSTYKYHVKPVIYQHDRLGCLMVAYDVQVGEDWQYGDASITRGRPCLIRPFPDAEDIKKAFSRAISFTKNPDGAFDIEVEIFNNGLTPVKDVACEFYDVSSLFLTDRPRDRKELTPAEHLLPKVKLPGNVLNPLERKKLKLAGRRFDTPKVYISVKLFAGNDSGDNDIYWRDYDLDKH